MPQNSAYIKIIFTNKEVQTFKLNANDPADSYIIRVLQGLDYTATPSLTITLPVGKEVGSYSEDFRVGSAPYQKLTKKLLTVNLSAISSVEINFVKEDLDGIRPSGETRPV